MAWGTLAIYWSGPRAYDACVVLSLAFLLAGAGVLWFVRPRPLAWLGCAALIAVVLEWWVGIPPRNDRDWQPDVAVLPWATVEGDVVTVHNVRDIAYRSESDYRLRHETWTVSLSQLQTLDLFLSYWGSPLIAHTIMSFGFADGRYLAVSIETRKEKGEDYSAIKGFFKQYELVYVVADERDVVRLRTNYRGEDVYLYRLRTPPDRVRGMFRAYLREINRLRERPEWYNALTHNCTTAIRGLVPPETAGSWRSWKLFLNGHLDELAYEVGALDHRLPFAALRTQSRITDRARAADQASDFSREIRAGLPSLPTP
jgi:hypothetical protein